MTFHPSPGSIRHEAIYLAIGCVTVIPAFGWWKGISWPLTALFAVVSFVGVLTADVYKIVIRGRDSVVIEEDGIRVANRRKGWTLAWTDISRVYKFEQQLYFETHPPHRRFKLVLEGHESHRKQMLEAIAERARSMNLAWFDKLANLLG